MARPIRRFTDMIGLLSRGRFAEKCDEKLVEAITALEALPDEEGTAEITIKIKVKYQSGRIDIVPAVASKLPAEKGFNATPFWSAEGGLSVEHPSQQDMFTREAPPRERASETA